MSAFTTQIETEDFFSDHQGSICGTAVMDVELVMTPNGPHYSCQLIGVRIGQLELTREQMCDAFSDKLVILFCQAHADRLTEEAA